MYFANAYFRYTLDINLTDDQVNHPLMREAEGIVADHVGLTNDYFSYAKERMTDSDHTNIIRILQEHEGLGYKEALQVVEAKITEKEHAFISAGLAVLNDPELGNDPEVRRWIECLPYCMGGNKAWSQETGRYNVGNVLDGVTFPSLSCKMEETPERDRTDLVELENGDPILGAPPPDFSLDVDPIGTSSGSALSVTLTLPTKNRPRPSDVGILALDVLLKDQLPDNRGMDFKRNHEFLSSFFALGIGTLLRKYNIDCLTIGRVDIAIDIFSTKKALPSWKGPISHIFHDSEIILSEPTTDLTAAFFGAVNWIESSIWDGRNAIVLSGSARRCVIMIIGPNASIVLEHTYGVCSDGTGPVASLPPTIRSLMSLRKAYISYQTKLATMFGTSVYLI
ncbi:isoprenoid synthase domain-containing protein [Collybia nuda]|uniref:Terpene synthase n=1 Tax=Collybia nuda TaxID=64659 RepID=A0A9P5XRY0_9AGAR|nr:isoprenoid synthase domain-containing protein [Collybia nuda]